VWINNIANKEATSNRGKLKP